MPRRAITETIDFKEGWKHNISKLAVGNFVKDLYDCWFDFGKGTKPSQGASVPRVFPEVALASLPRRNITETHSTRDVLSMYRAEDEAGNVLRLIQLDSGATSAIYDLNSDGTVGSALKSNLSTGRLVNYTTVTDPDGDVYIFCCNGAQDPWKIKVSDSSVSDIGLTSGRPDIVNVTLSKHADGNVAGVVKYFIAEISSGVQGPLSEGQERDSRNVPDAVKLSFDATTHTEFASNDYAIYRTYAFGVDPYYVGTVEVGASGTTDFIDNVHDDDLGNPPFTHGDPPPSEIIDWISYYERVYGITKDRVYWSDLGQPESWYTATDGNFIRFGFGDGDDGVALTRFGDSFIIWSNDHVYQVFGKIPSEFVLKEITPSDGPTKSIGTLDRRSITYAPDGQYFFWENRIYHLSRSKINPISTPIDGLIPYQTQDLTSYSSTKAALHFSSIYGRVFCSIASVDTSGHEYGRTFFWDIEDARWVGSSSWGYRTFMEDTDENDLPVTRFGGQYDVITATTQRDIGFLERTLWEDTLVGYFQTPAFGGQSFADKIFYWVDITFSDIDDEISDIGLSVRSDGLQKDIDAAATYSTSLSAAQSLDVRTVRFYLLGQNAKSMSFVFGLTPDGPRPWRVYSVTCRYAPISSYPRTGSQTI